MQQEQKVHERSIAMTAEAKEAYNAYMREWRKKNRSKAQEYKKRYWERKAGEAKKGDEPDENQKNA